MELSKSSGLVSQSVSQYVRQSVCPDTGGYWKTTIVEPGVEMAATSTDIFNSEREYEYQRVVNSLLSSSHTTVAVTRQLQPATRPSSARQLRRRQCEESGQDQRRYLTATSC